MTYIRQTLTWAGAACLAIVLAVAPSSFAQQQSDQDQSTQSDEQSTDEQYNESVESSDESSSDPSASNQSDESDATSDESDSQSSDESTESNQDIDQQTQQQTQRQQRQQQDQQRQPRQNDQSSDRYRSSDTDQSQSWGQSSQDRSRSDDMRRRTRSSRESDQWPSPDSNNYGSDSLRYDGIEQRSDRDSSVSRSSQQNGSRQGGLGVQIMRDDRSSGVVVTQVNEGSPAQDMGIREGDRITAVNGHQVQSVQQFISRIRSMDPGQRVELDIRRSRGGGERTLRGELESRQEALADIDQGRRQQRGQQFDGRRQSSQPPRGGFSDSDNWQTSYDEERQLSSQGRSGQVSAQRLDQIEQQVNRLSRQLNELRSTLASLRNQSGSERTARYEEYDGSSQRGSSNADWESDSQYNGNQSLNRGSQPRSTMRSDSQQTTTRGDTSGTGEFRQDTSRDAGGRGSANEQFDEGPGGEIGSDRQRVGSENINRD